MCEKIYFLTLSLFEKVTLVCVCLFFLERVRESVEENEWFGFVAKVFSYLPWIVF